MGFFGKISDFFSGTKRPESGTPVLSFGEVKKRVLDLDRDTAPFQIRDGGDEEVDVVAEWKIVDAKWYEIFAKAGLKKGFKILLHFDDEKHEVRALDKEFTVEWRAGIPSLSFSASAFRGQRIQASFGTAYAFTEEFKPGQVYNYRFSTNEMKKPLQEVITGCGWTYKGVTFGKLKG